MRKLLSIVLALTLVLGMLPVFANEYAQEGLSPAENLRHYKFIQGDNGDLKLDQTLTRAELATIIARMLGKDEEAKAFEAETSYDDRAKFPKWAKGYISFATAQGLMLGYDNKFDANGTVNSKQAATVFLRLLGYNQGEDFQYKEAVQFLRDKGVEMVEADKILRGDLFNTMWTVVSTEVMKEEGKILGAEHGMLPPPAPKFVPIAIDEVKADNLKEVTVKFNQEIKKDELGKFAVAGKTVETVELLEDAMTVKVTLADMFDNQKTYKLTVDKTAAVNELAGVLAKEEKEFNVFDATLPTVTSVEFAGPRNVVIMFSEPMKNVKGDIVIKKGNTTLAVDKVGMTIEGNVVTAKTFTSFAEGGEYEITISKFEDLAEYKNANHRANYTYNKDTTAPTVEVVNADSTKVVVRFNKPVKGIEAGMFWHSFTAWNDAKVTDADGNDVVANKPYTMVTATFYPGLTGQKKALPDGNVKFGINGDKIVDLFGNKLGTFETTVAVKADVEKPVVAEAVAVSKSDIKVTFSKDVDFKKAQVTAKADGASVIVRSVGKVKATDAKVWVVALNGVMEGKTVSLNIEGVQDLTPNMNTVVAYNGNIDFGDTTPPVITKVAFKVATATTPGEVYFFYSESVNEGATTGANYQYLHGGQYKKLATDGEFFGDAKVVRFVLTEKQAAEIAVGTDFLVSNVKDMAGVAIIVQHTANTKAQGYATVVAPMAVKVVATSPKTIVVTFNTDITELKHSDFTLNGGATKAASYEYLDTNKIKFTLDNELKEWAKAVTTDKLSIAADAIKNNFGQSNIAPQNNIAIVDMIQPEFKADTLAFDGATYILSIDLTKALDSIAGMEQAVALNDINVYVNDNKVPATEMSVALNATQNKLEVTLAPSQVPNGNNVVSIETTSGLALLRTTNGVKVKALPLTKTAEVASDFVKIKSVTVNKTEQPFELKITFDRAMNNGALTTHGNYTFTGAAAPVATAAAASEGDTVVTVTFGTNDLKKDHTLVINALVVGSDGKTIHTAQASIKVNIIDGVVTFDIP